MATTTMRRLLLFVAGVALLLSSIVVPTPLHTQAFAARLNSDDYPPAEWVASPNVYGGRGADEISMIVIHTTDTPGATFDQIIRSNTRDRTYVGAHYWVRSSDGHVVQMIRDLDLVGHAGHRETNRISIGIELEAMSTDGSGLSDALYQSTATLVQHLVEKYRIPLDRRHIIGHVEVPGCRKTPSLGGESCNPDPGAAWDWARFMSLVDGDGHTDWDSEPLSATGHFPDVKIDHTFFGYIEALYAVGAVQGTSQGLYLPDESVTRGQVAKILIELLDEYREYDDGICAFDDVCPDNVFYHYIRRLKELSITNGFSDGTYRPDAPISRAGLASLLVRSRGENAEYPSCTPPFSDVDCDNVHNPNIRRLKELFESKGFSLGYSDGSFRPDEETSRGAVAKLMVVALDRESAIPTFYDVLSDNKFYRYIEGIAVRGITDGCAQTPPRFCGGDELTRGQVTKFVVRAMGETPTYEDRVAPFPDVIPSDTFYSYIRHLKALGVVSGFSDGLFRANSPITRGEMAKSIVGSLAVKGVRCSYDQNPGFSDVAMTDTFYQDIQCLKELNITSGYSDGTFRTDNRITRAEAAKFVYLAFVQRIPSVAQEASDAVNNTQESAPSYASLTAMPGADLHDHSGAPRFTLPAGDEDWEFVDAPQARSAAAGAQPGLKISMQHLSLNADVRMQAIDVDGDLLAETQGAARAGNPALVLNSEQLGDGVYIKLENRNAFAMEGAHGYLVVEEIDVEASPTPTPIATTTVVSTPTPAATATPTATATVEASRGVDVYVPMITNR